MQGVHDYFNRIRQLVGNQTHRYLPIFCTPPAGPLIDPNDLPLDFNGVSFQMAVQGKRFASGVSDFAGKVPRFGETIIDVPVTISVFGIVRQTFDVMTNPYRGKLVQVDAIDYFNFHDVNDRSGLVLLLRGTRHE